MQCNIYSKTQNLDPKSPFLMLDFTLNQKLFFKNSQILFVGMISLKI